MAVTRRAQARGRAAQLHAADREVRRPGRGHPLRPARLPVRHGRREVRRQRRGDDRGDPAHQERVSGVEDHPRHLERVLRPAASPDARSSTRSSSTTATKAGLDLAIVNTEKIVRYPSIPEEERRLSEDLIYNRGADPVAAFANYFKAKGAAPKAPKVRAGTLARAASALHPRGLQGGPRRRPRGRAHGRDGASRHHQRTPHGRDARGRPPLQRERADRRGSPAVGGGDEGRGRAPREVHGEDRAARARAR